MNSPQFKAFLIATSLAWSMNSWAAVVWDGNGSPNSNGTWETANNWNPDGIPATSASVQLNDVTTGTRTVTISSGSPQTITQLALTQTTLGAVNRLDLNDSLTITGGTTAPLSVTASAGAGSVVVNVATGKTFLATRTNAATSTFGGTLNLLGTGSTFSQTSGGVMTASFSGSIQAAAGSSLVASGTSANLSFSGNSTFGTGANILLQYTSTSGAGTFSNSGTLLMDGSTFTYDWSANVAGGGGQNGTRNYNNSGSWTLKNESSLVLISSGNMQTGGGFANLANSENSGTLNLESGSILTSRSFFNTGTLNLGSSTGGLSDAGVIFGGNLTTDIFLNNGYTSATTPVISQGTINVKGNAVVGRSTAAGNVTLNNGSGSATGSFLNIGDGAVTATLTISSINATLNNFSGNTVNVRSAATLLLAATSLSNALGNVALVNDGALVQSGKIQFRSNNASSISSGLRTFGNTGTHTINGTTAVIESLTNSGTAGSGIASAITYTNSGRLTGASGSDKLSYTNSSGNAANEILTLGISGEITPGNGSNGSGTASIGALAFENINVSLSGAAKLTFDIGGTAGSGLFDTISLTGTGATFALGAGGILDIRTVNGANPFGSYVLLSASSVTGTFNSLLYNGAVVTGEYTIDYLGNGIQINFAAIPEPSAAILLLGAVGGLIFLRRRRQP